MEAKLPTYSLNKFAAEFYNELDVTTSVCSPLSAVIALALLTLGSKNDTHTELQNALGFPDDDAIRSSFLLLNSHLKSMKDTLKVATKVYLKKGEYELKSHLKKDAEEVFDAALEQIDFEKGATAADEINKWMANQTNDKIKNIVSADMMNEDTRIILLNAIYFKDTWKIQFSGRFTEERPFYVNATTVINVPMMTNPKDYFRYGISGELKSQILELQYISNNTSMVIVLPNKGEDIKGVLQKLAAGHDLMAEIQSLSYDDVHVSIPKFKVETTIDLKKILPKLGISRIFDKSAEIDMLTTSEKLFVSDAIQKVFINVNESGTEAAASTALKIMQISMPMSFVADRPFLYLLTAQQIPFFMGTYRGNGIEK